MKRTFISALILVVAFFAILFAATKSNDVVVNMETGENGEYLFVPIFSLLFAVTAAYYFRLRSVKPLHFLIPTLLAITVPLFAGITTFLVAGCFSAIIIVTTDEKVLQWFKGAVDEE